MNSLLTFGLALTLMAPGPKEVPKKAPPAIVGEWECVGLVLGGRVITPEEMKEIGVMRYEFSADGKHRGNFGPQVNEGTYTTDAAKDPPELNTVSAKNGGNAGGIYKVEKDFLTLCFTEGGKDRPKQFDSPAGTRVMLMTFKRVEKKK